MANKFYEHQDFLKMRAVWYKKLRKAGFKDVEVRSGVSDMFLRPELHVSKGSHNSLLKAEADTLRHQFLYAYKFKDAFDRKVWTSLTKNGGLVHKDDFPKNTKNEIDYRLRRLKVVFEEWRKEQCQNEPGQNNYDPVVLLREMEEEDAAHATTGAMSMKPRGEYWVPGRGWVNSNNSGEG